MMQQWEEEHQGQDGKDLMKQNEWLKSHTCYTGDWSGKLQLLVLSKSVFM